MLTLVLGDTIMCATSQCRHAGTSVVFKHHTEIGARAFIGSNTMLVAPVRVGDEAMTGSGSVITTDVPDGAIGIARARQSNKEGLARRLFASLRAAKAAKSAKNKETTPR